MIARTYTNMPTWDVPNGYQRDTIAGVVVEWQGQRPGDDEVKQRHKPARASMPTVDIAAKVAELETRLANVERGRG